MKFKGQSQKTFLQKVYFEKIKDINTHIKAREAYNKKKEMDEYLKDNKPEVRIDIVNSIIPEEKDTSIEEKKEKIFNILKKFHSLSLTTEEEIRSENIEINSFSDNKIRVFEVMTTKVRSVIESTTMGNCIALINKYNISSLPVINPFNRELVGIITMKDIVNHLLDHDNFKKVVSTDGYSSFHDTSFYFFEEPVSKYMKTKLITIDPESEVAEASEKMLNHKIHRLLVTRNKRLIGVFSAFDVLKVVGKFGVNKLIEDQVS